METEERKRKADAKSQMRQPKKSAKTDLPAWTSLRASGVVRVAQRDRTAIKGRHQWDRYRQRRTYQTYHYNHPFDCAFHWGFFLLGDSVGGWNLADGILWQVTKVMAANILEILPIQEKM